VHGKSFNEVQSLIMTRDGEVEGFGYWIFDWVKDNLEKRYELRCQDMRHYIMDDPDSTQQVLFPIRFYDNSFTTLMVGKNMEGVILRTSESPYKCGRSTLQEQYMLKYVVFSRDEACVIGFLPLIRDNGKVTKLLGSLIISWKGEILNIGSGFSNEERFTIWNKQGDYLNKVVTFKYKPHGMKDKPRMPIFVGFRDSDDIIV
jgi:DNA ligase-1